MKKIILLLLMISVMVSAWAGGVQEKTEPADMVLTNAAVYTVDEQSSWAEAVAVTDGRIVAVGTAEEIEAYIGDSTDVMDLDGKMVMPSFIDAHMHPASSAVAYLYQITLYDVFSLEEYLVKIADFVAENPEMNAYEGAGYMRSAFDEVGPRKEDLDLISPDKPMALMSVDGHSMWVNSKAFELTGITKDSPDPAGGVIKRDPVTGEPSGLLQESAMGLVSDLFTPPTKEMYKEGILFLQEWFNAVGLTTCHDAMVTFDPNYYMAYEELARDGLLTVRFRGSWILAPEMIGGAYGIDASVPGEEMTVDEAIEHGMALSETFETEYWQVNSFKFFSDQVIEEETGLLKEPYSHRDDDWYGIQVWDAKFLNEAFRKVDAEGYNIHIHQIGDAAATYALDALEYAREMNGERDSRHTFAHLQMIDQPEIERMGELGMNAIIAPYWTIVDDYYWDLYLPYLGQQRAYMEMYPAQSLFDAGVNTAIHSDFFVTEPDYGWALYSAVTRTMPEKVFQMWYGEDTESMIRTTEYSDDLEYYTMGPLGPAEERISLADAIKAATINGAWADFLDEDLGSIEVGKLADIIVIDRNLLDIDIEEVADLEVLMTYFEGEMVYSAE